MVDAVAGQDHERAFRREVSIEQALCEPAHDGERLRIGEGAPCAGTLPLGEKDALRGEGGPIMQPVRQSGWNRRKRLHGSHNDHSIRTALDLHLRRSDRRVNSLPDASHLRESVTFAARFSRNAVIRCLASSLPWAIAAINASMKNPSRGLAPAVRGSA